MKNTITTLIIAATFAGGLAWMGRYELHTAATLDRTYTYQLDRWTGELIVFQTRGIGAIGARAEVIE